MSRENKQKRCLPGHCQISTYCPGALVRATAACEKHFFGIGGLSHHVYISTCYLEGLLVDSTAVAETPIGIAEDVVKGSLIGLEQYLAADWPAERMCSRQTSRFCARGAAHTDSERPV